MTNAQENAPDRPGGLRTGADHGTQTAAEDLAQSAEEEAGALKQQARDAGEAVKREAREAVDQVKEQAYSTADRQKDVAAQQMGGWAHALRAASDDLRSRGQDVAAAYVGQAADGLERASGTVRQRDVDLAKPVVAQDAGRSEGIAFQCDLNRQARQRPREGERREAHHPRDGSP